MKKFLALFLIFALVMTTGLVGCGTATDDNAGTQEPATGGEGSEPVPQSDLKIGMVTDVGGVHDNSFNQSAWEALEKLETDTGVSVKYVESKKEEDYETNLNTFVQDNWDLTWGIGAMMESTIKKVAGDHPDSKFAIIDAPVVAPNVVSVTYKEHEGSFLVGVVAGMMTKTNKVGFVGGMKIPVIVKFEEGFKAGVKAVNPDAQVSVSYAGDFSRSDLGKNSAATLYDQGADIVFHAAGKTGDGVFTEAQSRRDNGEEVWVIGVDKDQSVIFGDEITLTSMMKDVYGGVYDVSKSLVDGTFKGGESIVLGLAEDGVGLPEKNPNLPQEVLDKVEEYKTKIVSGEVVVPFESAE